VFGHMPLGPGEIGPCDRFYTIPLPASDP
jgi:hypothetical protein